MSNQIAIASNMMGVCEAVAYAKKCGLNPQDLLDVISTGAAGSWSISNLAPRMLKGDFAPGFFIKHFIKTHRIKRNPIWTSSHRIFILFRITIFIRRTHSCNKKRFTQKC